MTCRHVSTLASTLDVSRASSCLSSSSCGISRTIARKTSADTVWRGTAAATSATRSLTPVPVGSMSLSGYSRIAASLPRALCAGYDACRQLCDARPMEGHRPRPTLGERTVIMKPDNDTVGSEAADAITAPLDLLLTDAAIGMLRRVNPDGSGLRLAAALAGRPRLVAGRSRRLAGELGRIAVGSSQVQPSRRDRRFADPAWAGNPLLRRAMQAYLAAAETAEGVVAEAGLDDADSERVGFVLTNLIDALAPSNTPLLNPAAVKAAVDTGGGSVVAGLRHFVSDMAVPPRVPSMVQPDAFEGGVDLAVTPGSVVLRTPVFELIQYRPTTAAVRQVPLVIVPPTINKFYVMDLAPGRSLVEYLVGSGLQVFMISWRNPDARHAKWDFDTYGQAVLDAMDA